ncbi:ferric reductase-like transmembrane domain-containing protein [Helicobacter cappadocius]|uniref:ferric reductase-like transmembrane domain-containing protein n=1 Tax=Helicobacter cappadocius TaxID=3063998 RepID=UPI00351E3A5C
MHFLGDWSIYFILISLLFSSFSRFLKASFINKNFKILRKIAGLHGLFYAILHFLAYVIFEQDGNVKNTLSEILLRVYLFFGFWALIGLFILGFFSFFFSRYFYLISSLSYLVGLLSSIHYLLGQKIPSITSYIIFMIFLILICVKLLSKNLTNKDIK